MPPEFQHDLIFDFGFSNGDDTDFYLAKGFRVVAVDASPQLCAEGRRRFAGQIADGRLHLVERALADRSGTVQFFPDANGVWGTTDPDWQERNRRMGGSGSRQLEPITVEATTVDDLLQEYGVPYYVKIDIEGLDLTALQGFAAQPVRPRYVSIESDKTSFRTLRHEFDVLADLGYDRFKLVSQRAVPKQQLPHPALEGSDVAYTFPHGSSGAFGEETPGAWVGRDDAIERYRRVFLQYALTGDDPYIRSKYVRLALKALGLRTNWFDTHAKLAGA